MAKTTRKHAGAGKAAPRERIGRADMVANEGAAIAPMVFGQGGALGRAMGSSFHPNPMQVEYGRRVLATVARGMVPANEGRITIVEAGTGTGKTQGCLIPALLAAVASGGRSMYATNTRALLRQIMTKEARVAIAVVEDLTGVRTTVAPYRARSSFVSPTRAGDYVDELRREDKEREAEALEAFIEHDRLAKERLDSGDVVGVVSEVDGLLESFVDNDPERGQVLSTLPHDKWCLTGDCPGPEYALWDTFRVQASQATLVLVTHAALLQEVRFAGRLLDSEDRPYSLVVIDEAHLLEGAAESALSDRRSVHELSLECRKIEEALGDRASAHATRVAEAAALVVEHADVLLEQTRADVDERHAERGRILVHGDEPWLDTLARCERAFAGLLAALGKSREGWRRLGVEASTVDDLVSKERSLRSYNKACAWRRGRKDDRKPFLTPYLRFTPVRYEPVLEIVPNGGQMILARLWGNPDDGAEATRMAKAVFFTSATLGDPTRRGWEALQSRAYGLGIGSQRSHVNQDLCATLEPDDFGAPTFFLADDQAPAVSSGADGEHAMTAQSVAFAAHAIGLAAAAGGRTMVPISSFRDAAHLAAAIPARLRGRLIVRRQGASAFSVLDAFVKSPDGILIAPGIDTGTDLPVRVDNLVITRLPFPPPRDVGEGPDFGRTHSQMIVRLRQILGRCIRRHDDRPRIYVTDPSFGLSPRLLAENLGVTCTRSRGGIAAVPRRFAQALDRAEIIRVPPALVRRAAA